MIHKHDENRNFYFSLPPDLQKDMNAFKTPFFVFDPRVIEKKFQRLAQTLGPDRIYYALKANSLPPVLDALNNSGCSFEVNNMPEFEKARATGADPTTMINSSPIASPGQVRALFKAGVTCFCFDSESQIRNLANNAPGADVYLRIFITNQGSKLDLNRRFGVRVSEAERLLVLAKKSGLNLHGITFHVGSQCVNINNWRIGLTETGKLFKLFPEMSVVNIGGGFPVCYNESIPTIDEISRVIKEEIRCNFSKQPQLWVEPGRFLVADAAFTAASVIQVDERPRVGRVIVDMSVFTGFIEKLEFEEDFHYPVFCKKPGEKKLYNILGNSCDGTDIIALEVYLPELSDDCAHPFERDRILFFNTGAYTLDYSPYTEPFGFNGARMPAVYFIENGKFVRSNGNSASKAR